MLLELNERSVGGISSPIYFQGKYFCHFYTNMMSASRKKFEKQFYDARIYLNIKLENRLTMHLK